MFLTEKTVDTVDVNLHVVPIDESVSTYNVAKKSDFPPLESLNEGSVHNYMYIKLVCPPIYIGWI